MGERLVLLEVLAEGPLLWLLLLLGGVVAVEVVGGSYQIRISDR